MTKNEELVYHSFVDLISQFDESKALAQMYIGNMQDIITDALKDATDQKEQVLMNL